MQKTNKKPYNKKQRNDGKNKVFSNDQSPQYLYQKKMFDRKTAYTIPKEEILANQEAIKQFKSQKFVCKICQKPIEDISMALQDKTTTEPCHFDCVLSSLNETTKLQANEKISYIGQGKFAVIHFQDVKDTKHFEMKKIIEWEDKDKTSTWRPQMANLFSQVK